MFPKPTISILFYMLPQFATSYSHQVPLQNNECNFRKDILYFSQITEMECQIVLNANFLSTSMTEAYLQISTSAQTVL